MHNSIIGILAALVLTSLRCAPGDGTEDNDTTEPDVLYFEPVGSGQSGSIADTTEVVFRDSTEWLRASSALQPREPLAAVDFSQYMVVLVALPQVSGGFRVEFESIESAGDSITASYVVYAPDSDCMTISALTLPFQAVAVRRADGDVRFRRSVTRESCLLP